MNRRLLAVLLAGAIVPTAHAAITEPPGVAAALRPAADEQPAFVLNAEGVQIYECKPKKTGDASGYQWTFVAPEATLKEDGATVGSHGAGPTWVSSSDRSSVQGAMRQRQDGGAGNIPWLLLAATPTEGAGRFAGVTSIQRVATKGGVEPSDTCDASRVGQAMRVPYTADYYFYKRR